MRRWTNDRWSSTLHRVVNPPKEKAATWGRRLAIAFFHNLNKVGSLKIVTRPFCILKQTFSLGFSWVWGSQHLWEHPALSGRTPLTTITPRSHSTSHSSYWEYITIRRTTHLTCLKVPIIYTMCWCVSACLCTGCDGRSHTFLRQQRTACLVRFHCAFACVVYHC